MPDPEDRNEFGDSVEASFDDDNDDVDDKYSLFIFAFIDCAANGLCRRWNMTRISVAVTQSCSIADVSKSTADGRPSNVLNAIRDPCMPLIPSFENRL